MGSIEHPDAIWSLGGCSEVVDFGVGLQDLEWRNEWTGIAGGG